MHNTLNKSHKYVEVRTPQFTKRLLFLRATKKYYHDLWLKIANISGVSMSTEQANEVIK